MEDDLDAISRGERGHLDYLNRFYFGAESPGLKPQLASKVDEIDARDVSRVRLGGPDLDPPVFVRVGRFGPFLEQGERRAPVPEDLPPDEMTLDKALELLGRAQQGEEPLGHCPDTGKPVFLKSGRFGPYVQRGTADDPDGKPKNASLLKGMTPEDVTLEVALQLLSLPREVGRHPTDGQPIVAHNGRFGPYVQHGSETRSLGAETTPLAVTLEQALDLLSKPKQGRRSFGQARAALRELGPSPVTSAPVQLFEGRYGPYVSDGATNASLPKGLSTDELKLDDALALLAARAAAGGSKKKPFRRGAAGAKTAKAAKATKTAKKAPARKKKKASSPGEAD
jgi:DNA topoisomerase-1